MQYKILLSVMLCDTTAGIKRVMYRDMTAYGQTDMSTERLFRFNISLNSKKEYFIDEILKEKPISMGYVKNHVIKKGNLVLGLHY